MTDTQESLYEHLFPLTTIMKQRVVENFNGKTLDEKWTARNQAGTNTFQMSDEVDGGFEIITGTTLNNEGQLDFNDIEQYDETAVVFIYIGKSEATTLQTSSYGMVNDQVVGFRQLLAIRNNTAASSFYAGRTSDASASTETDTSISIDTLYHVMKGEVKSSSFKATMDGILESTISTTMPTLPLQPYWFQATRTSAAKTGHVSYFEAYNT